MGNYKGMSFWVVFDADVALLPKHLKRGYIPDI